MPFPFRNNYLQRVRIHSLITHVSEMLLPCHGVGMICSHVQILLERLFSKWRDSSARLYLFSNLFGHTLRLYSMKLRYFFQCKITDYCRVLALISS